ncbi:carnitine dehydratase [Prauserella sp. PE36]|uniref:CaiB/BaiF CoA transferase family protein n=1 Tax=Prauserella sp. PE36 TaxID=1504709 RepID=UPI000DE505FE|nr:CaiB/BaiF CoA-transferase family protein [Prauserella sp. PE36]RBM18788.1 carnitine dehydratase [Prauserella sp. PE36]
MFDRSTSSGPRDDDSSVSAGPLTGLRVVSLEHAVAAPLCSRHLADLGADVIKVERPDGGDLARGYDTVVAGQSAYFVWANRGKRSVALDLKTDAGRRTLGNLLSAADVFVHNLGPGAVDRLGYGREVVRSRYPRLINCAISGYGVDGPYRDRKAFDLLIQGEAGLMSVTGSPDEPAKVGVSVADMCAAVYALSAVLAAVLRRGETGEGAFIDISMLDCLSEWMMAPTYHQLYAGRQPPRAGARHNMMVPYGVYRVGSDAFVNFAVQTQQQWRRLCEQVLRSPELIDDPRFTTNEARVRNRAELEPIIERHFRALTEEDAQESLRAAGIPTGAVNDLKRLAEHPQHAARARWFEVDSPNGPVRALRSPFNLDGVSDPASAIPGLGEHTEEILADLRATRPSG